MLVRLFLVSVFFWCSFVSADSLSPVLREISGNVQADPRRNKNLLLPVYNQCKEESDSFCMMIAGNLLYICYSSLNEQDSALLFLNRTIKLAELRKDSISIAKLLLNKGMYLESIGRPEEAIAYYGKSRFRAEKLGIPELTVYVLLNSGNLYYKSSEWEKALGYYQEGMRLNEDTLGTIQAQFAYNIAACYAELHQNDSARHYNLISIDLHEQHEAFYLLSKAYVQQGAIEFGAGKLREAEAFYQKGISCADKSSVAEARIFAAGGLGSFYNALGEKDKALTWLTRAVSIDTAQAMAHHLGTLAGLHREKGNWKEAFRYQDHAYKLERANYSTQLATKLASFQNSFENYRNAREKAEMKLSHRLQEVKLEELASEKKFLLLLGFSSLLFVISLGAFALWRSRAIARHKAKEARLYGLWSGEMKERTRLARELHDSVGQMLAATKMRLPENAGESVVLLDKTMDEVRTISHDLLPEALHFGLCSALQSLSDQMNVEGKGPVLEGNLKQDPDPMVSLHVYRIIQELLNNARKHGSLEGMKIILGSLQDRIEIKVVENVNTFQKSDSRSGIGWKNLCARAEQSGIQLKVKRENEKMVYALLLNIRINESVTG